MTHTPTPWVYPEDDTKAPDLAIFSAVKPKGATSEYGACVAHVTLADAVTGFLPKGQHRANAAFIVRACNSHDKLVEALRSISGHIDHNSGRPTAAAQIAQRALEGLE